MVAGEIQGAAPQEAVAVRTGVVHRDRGIGGVNQAFEITALVKVDGVIGTLGVSPPRFAVVSRF